jgi:hypothetical protein
MCVITAYGSDVPLSAPATFLRLLACRDTSSFILCRMFDLLLSAVVYLCVVRNGRFAFYGSCCR